MPFYALIKKLAISFLIQAFYYLFLFHCLSAIVSMNLSENYAGFTSIKTMKVMSYISRLNDSNSSKEHQINCLKSVRMKTIRTHI